MNPLTSPNDNTDVRMKGFARRSTVEAAMAWVDTMLPTFDKLPVEEVALCDAPGRILGCDVISSVNVPAFPRSMMDGFALRSDQTHGATAYNGLPFAIVGNSLPGKPHPGVVLQGQAVRIMTGAPLPAGADAVMPVEQTQTQGDTVLVTGEVTSGKHVGSIGEDVQCGALLLRSPRLLRPQDIGVLSSIGCSRVTVIRRPTVRILITGNELLPSGIRPSGFQITDANGPMLQALVVRDGGQPVMPGLICDDRQNLLAALQVPADIVLISGGSSVGIDDHAPVILAAYGTLAIHGIAMRPSSPTGMGLFQNRPVFLLPGNPVSCLCAYDFFAGRAIRALAGRDKDWPYRRIQATLTRKLVSTVGRVDYARVILDGNVAEPLAIHGASVLTSTTQADGFVIIEADSEGYAAHSQVDVYLY